MSEALRHPPTPSASRAQRHTTVTIGGVTVRTPTPSKAQVKANIEAGSRALQRARDRLLKPGIHLPPKKDVPLYSADPDTPDVYIRILNGKTSRGVMENGAFKAID